ncbi:MAG: hypothetical protein FWC41_05415 [Firmicutes bacterium]|nr:hypothetical protein [Bacillota bacterium]
MNQITISINSNDVDLLKKILQELSQQGAITVSAMKKMCNENQEQVDKLKSILVSLGLASNHWKTQINKTDKTDDAINLNIIENLYNKERERNQKENREKEKTELQIKELKRNRYLSFAAIFISAISLIISVIIWIIK